MIGETLSQARSMCSMCTHRFWRRNAEQPNANKSSSFHESYLALLKPIGGVETRSDSFALTLQTSLIFDFLFIFDMMKTRHDEASMNNKQLVGPFVLVQVKQSFRPHPHTVRKKFTHIYGVRMWSEYVLAETDLRTKVIPATSHAQFRSKRMNSS